MASFGGFKTNFLGNSPKKQSNFQRTRVKGFSTNLFYAAASAFQVPVDEPVADPSMPPGNFQGLLSLWSTVVDSKVLEHKKSDLLHQPAGNANISTGTEATKVTTLAFCPYSSFEKFAIVGDQKGKITLVEVGLLGMNFGISQSTEDYSVKAVGWMKDSQGQIMAVSTEKEETLVIWRVNFEKRSLRMHKRCIDVISESTNKGLRCIATHPDVPDLIAAAGQSGTLFIYHKNLIFPTYKIKKAHQAERASDYSSGLGPRRSEVLGLIFKDEKTIISAGAVDRKVKIWNFTNTDSKHPAPIAVYELGMDISSIALDHSNLSKLYVSCMDNSIYCYNTNSSGSAPCLKFTGHRVAEKTGIRVSPCGSFIASGCTSGCIFVWSTTGVQKFAIVTPLFKLKGHLKEVNIVDWCYGNGLFKLLSASEDNSLRAWRHSEDIKETFVKGQGCMEILDNNYRKKMESISKFPFNLNELAPKTKGTSQPPAQKVESTCLEVDDEFDEDSCNSSEYSDEEMNEDSDVSDDEYLDYSEELESGDECLPNAVWVKLSKL